MWDGEFNAPPLFYVYLGIKILKILQVWFGLFAHDHVAST
jgi:hypothetical protein